MGYGAKAQTPLLRFVVDCVEQICNKSKVTQQIHNILTLSHSLLAIESCAKC